METTNKKPVKVLSRPADKSLEAYKVFINSFCDALGIGGDDLTEQEWQDGWKPFWEKGGK